MTYEIKNLSLKFLHQENSRLYHPLIIMWKHLINFMNIY